MVLRQYIAHFPKGEKLGKMKFSLGGISVQKNEVEEFIHKVNVKRNDAKRDDCEYEVTSQAMETYLKYSYYSGKFAKLSILQMAANTVSESRETKKQFMTYGNELNRLMKHIDRDDISKADRERKDAVIAIFDELKKKKKYVDNTDIMVQINGILGDYILIERTPDDNRFAKRFDISKIDFDLL